MGLVEDIDLVRLNVKAYEKNSDFFIERTDNADVKNIVDRFSDYVGNGRILDAGCAQGRDSSYFHEKGFEVVGIDLSSSLLAVAEKRVPEAFFYNMDSRNLDFKDGVFDGIFAMGLLLCMDDEGAYKTLKAFNRVGADDGKLYVATKKGSGLLESKLDTGRIVQTLYSRQEMDNMLNSSGWMVDDYYESGSVIDDPVIWMNYFCRKRNSS